MNSTQLKPALWHPGIQLESDLARGIQIALPLWEGAGTTLADVSGNGRHCTLETESWKATEKGTVINLTGGNHVTFPTSFDAPEEATFALWVRWIGTQTEVVSTGDVPTVFGPILAFMASGTQIDSTAYEQSRHVLAINDPDPDTGVLEYYAEGATLTLQGSTPVGDGVWRFVVLTYQEGEYNLYLDGELEATGTGSTEFLKSLDLDPPEITSTVMQVVDHGNGCELEIGVGTTTEAGTDWFSLSGNYSDIHGWAVDVCVPDPGDGEFWDDSILKAQDVLGTPCDGNTSIWINPGGTTYATNDSDFVHYMSYTDSTDWSVSEWKIVQYLINNYQDFSALGTLFGTYPQGEDLCPSKATIANWIDSQQQPEDCWQATGCFGGSAAVDATGVDTGQTWLVNISGALNCISITDTASCDGAISVTPIMQMADCDACKARLFDGGFGNVSGATAIGECWQFICWDRVLTSGEVSSLYQFPTALFTPASPVVYGQAANSYDETGAGGLRVGGAAFLGNSYEETSTGGLTVSADTSHQQSHAETGTGGLEVSGTATESSYYAATGGLVASANTSHQQTHAETGTGGLRLLPNLFANGHRYRVTLTLAAFADIYRFPVAISVTLPPGDTPAVAFQDSQGATLAHSLRDWDSTTGQWRGFVKCPLSASEATTIYLYYGGAE